MPAHVQQPTALGVGNTPLWQSYTAIMSGPKLLRVGVGFGYSSYERDKDCHDRLALQGASLVTLPCILSATGV
jgi:hypothetical protein